MCRAKSCDLQCKGRKCEQTCNNLQGTCELKCERGQCTQTCKEGTCDLKCNGSGTGCKQTCKGDACSLECNSNTCEQTCFRDCILKCREGSCKQKCSELNDQGTCKAHCPVAGHASKCQQNCPSKKSQCTKNFINITEAPTWTGKRSNESGIVLRDPALKRGDGKWREAPSSFPSFFCSPPFLLSQILVLI